MKETGDTDFQQLVIFTQLVNTVELKSKIQTTNVYHMLYHNIKCSVICEKENTFKRTKLVIIYIFGKLEITKLLFYRSECLSNNLKNYELHST